MWNRDQVLDEDKRKIAELEAELAKATDEIVTTRTALSNSVSREYHDGKVQDMTKDIRRLEAELEHCANGKADDDAMLVQYRQRIADLEAELAGSIKIPHSDHCTRNHGITATATCPDCLGMYLHRQRKEFQKRIADLETELAKLNEVIDQLKEQGQ